MPDIFTSPDGDQQQKKPQPTVSKQPVSPRPPIQKLPQEKNQQIQSVELKQEAVKTIEQEQDATADLPEKLQVKPHLISLFSHYCPNPMGISFVNQERDEAVVLFIRRHFITNVPWIATFLFMLILPIIAYILFTFANLTLFQVPLNLMIIMLSFYYLVILNYGLTKFIEWFYHVGIVTKKRLLDLDVDNILHHHLAETNLTEVVDVSYAQQGFFQSFFNYGNVPIQTEAIKANFEFEASPQPATVSDIITDLRQLIPHHGGSH